MSTLIRLDDVSVVRRRLDTLVYALRGVSLTVPKGSWVGVIGPNGSGKSTLSRVLADQSPVTTGNVTRSVDVNKVRIVMQNPDAQIVGETVYEDLVFGMELAMVPPSEMDGRAIDALHRVRLQVPLDTPVEHLSGGQKQLLCIAAAMVTNPDCIVFDEPTAMLDGVARQHVLTAVANLHQQGLTVIWVTQWSEELVSANRAIALNDGRIDFDGLPRDFFYEACANLGYPPPYAVRVAMELSRHGVTLPHRPVTAQELHNALKEIASHAQ